MTIVITVPGVPRPGGSKRAFVNPKTGRAIVTEDCKRSKEWRAVVAMAAQQAMVGHPLFDGPIRVDMIFHMPRPRAHYGTGKNATRLKDSAPRYCTPIPDVLKLARSTEDAMKGIVYVDDSRIVIEHLEKPYGTPTGATITVSEVLAGADERTEIAKGKSDD